MKILYLCHRIPYPPNKGDKIRSFNEIKYLSAFHKIDLACLADNPRDLKYENNLKAYCRHVFCQPFNTIIARMKSPFPPIWGGFQKGLISTEPLSVGYFYSKKLQKIIDQCLLTTQYNAVICFSSPMAEYIFRSGLSLKSGKKCLSNNSIRLIMDFCDLDSDKWRQYAENSKFPMNLIYKIEHQRLLKYEKKINRCFDRSIFISRNEAELFFRFYPQARSVSVIKSGVDFEYFSSLTPLAPLSFSKRGGLGGEFVLLFTGAMDYHANIDGVLWFYKEIFPRIQSIFTEAKFYIVGSNPHKDIIALKKNKNIIVTGFVEDIRQYYEMADICVVPLRLARGIQNKALEAMSMQKPIVITSRVAEGIDATDGVNCLIADKPQAFADAVLNLLKDENLKNRIAKNARQFVKTSFKWQDAMKKLEELLE